MAGEPGQENRDILRINGFSARRAGDEELAGPRLSWPFLIG
jgi:hypothetical protein